MQQARRDGFYFVLLGAVVFLLIGFALERASPAADADFRMMYYSARCVVEHHDPYQEAQMRAIYMREAHLTAAQMTPSSPVITKLVYLPTVFLVTAPLALFSYSAAHALWLLATLVSLILAAMAVWDVAAAYAPVLAGALVGAMLANSDLFLVLGNPSGVVIGLSVLAAWSFIRNRHAGAGVFCLALCLMMKPHQAGPVWMFFLLAGGAYRRRAVQTLLVTAALSAPVLLYATATTPGWPQDLRETMAAAAARGAMNDPGPTSDGSHGIGMMISAQTAFSLIRDDPRFYNLASYVLCAPLILVWGVRVWRVRPSAESAWFALAPITALSMLPVYHRMYDARLMLLAVPACAILWARRGVGAWLGAAFMAASVLITSAVPWAVFLLAIARLPLPGLLGSKEAVLVMQMVPVPLTLLVTGCFFLWTFFRSAPESAAE